MSTKETKDAIEIPTTLIEAFGAEDCQRLAEIIAEGDPFWTEMYKQKHVAWTSEGRMVTVKRDIGSYYEFETEHKGRLNQLPNSAQGWISLYMQAISMEKYLESEKQLADWLQRKYPEIPLDYGYKRCALTLETGLDEEKKSPAPAVTPIIIPALLVKAFGVEDCQLLAETIAEGAPFWKEMYKQKHLIWTPAGDMIEGYRTCFSMMEEWKNHLDKLPKSAQAWALEYLDALSSSGQQYLKAMDSLTDWLRAKYPNTPFAFDITYVRQSEA